MPEKQPPPGDGADGRGIEFSATLAAPPSAGGLTSPDSTGGGDPPATGPPARAPAAAGSAPDDPVVINGQYVLLEPIGRTRMSEVWRAYQRTVGRDCAVKLIRLPENEPNEVRQRRLETFRNEVRAMGRINHPHVVTIYEAGETDETPRRSFIAMELLKGEDLDKALKSGRTFSRREVVRMLGGAANALRAAHAVGVYHRDIKPLNLFVVPSADGPDYIKVLDFGVCHLAGARESTSGAPSGTPIYMAPEQWRGDPCYAPTDVFLLAETAYEMLNDRLSPDERSPFPRGAWRDFVFRKQADRDGPPPTAPRLSRCPFTNRIFDRAFDVDLGRRPQTPVSFVRQLGVALWACRLAPIVAAVALVVALAALLLPGSAPVSTAERGREGRAAVGSLPDAPSSAPDGTVGGGADGGEAGARAAVTEPWPERPLLLVVPFGGAPDRDADRTLWPLADRMVVNALATDDRIRGSIRRVDPLAVQDQIERREMDARLDADDAMELATALGADVILRGDVHRRAGAVELRGTLRAVASGREAPVEARGPDIVAAAYALAREAGQTLGIATGPPTDERAARLLFSGPDVAAAVGEMDARTSARARNARIDALLAAHADDCGLVWQRLLDAVWDEPWYRAFARCTEHHPDPDLGAFARAIQEGRGADTACDAEALHALGERYPEVIGPLAAAVCHHRRGELSAAIRAGREAFGRLPLRPLAAEFLYQTVGPSGTCADQLPLRREMQDLAPEQPNGWAHLAWWYARCDRLPEALDLLVVARGTAGGDRRARYLTAYNAMLVHLSDLDVDGARPWFDLLEQSRDPTRDDADFDDLALRSQFYYLQGRFLEGMALVGRGLEALPAGADEPWSMLAISFVSVALATERLDEASRVVEAFGARFAEASDASNRGWARALALALDRSRGGVADDELVRRLGVIGEDVARALGGEVGARERNALECILLAELGLDAPARDVLERASPANRFLGGCRLRSAERLLREGHAPAAQEEFRRAVAEMVSVRFVYADLVPAALLGQARATEAIGDREAARRLYEKLAGNYRDASVELPEVREARAALVRLTGPATTPSPAAVDAPPLPPPREGPADPGPADPE